MFKAAAEGWNWTPEQMTGLTPTQIIKLSGEKASGGSGGQIDLSHPDQYAAYRRLWMEWNGPEALARRAERLYERYLRRGV